MTATPYVLDTTGGTVTGSIGIGSVISASTGTVTGTISSMAVYSAYATGKWVVASYNPGVTPGTATSGTVTWANNVETSWYCRSFGLTGESVKVSNLPGVG
jgi:hypothetical protein